MCVCVCVCERERERERESTQTLIGNGTSHNLTHQPYITKNQTPYEQELCSSTALHEIAKKAPIKTL